MSGLNLRLVICGLIWIVAMLEKNVIDFGKNEDHGRIN